MKSTIVSVIGALVITFSASATLAKGKGTPGKNATVQQIEMSVTEEGFVPAQVKVKAGQPVKLIVTRKTARTCAKEIVIKAFGINQPLPFNQPVEVTFTPTKAGSFRYACAMDMIAGVIVVE
ncbi:MAG TPA: cupredoxin domain-containing protein [Polyangia bacterium]|jgi:plastocyanin domain-containing protein|nr:cupredoxin domain-containing protein [Polyangia bacterium]